MIAQLAASYPVSRLCAVLGIARSTVYYQPKINAENTQVLAAMETILLRWPFYGYRRLTAQLKRQGWKIGERRVRGLLKQLDYSRNVGRVAVKTTNSNHNHQRFPNLIKQLLISAPNQVWVADITYIRLGRRFIYLAIILDAYTRALRGWQLDHSLQARQLTIKALKMALDRHPAPAIHHSDQGIQYAIATYRKLLPETAQISMSATGQPTENGIVERFIRTLKEEHIDYSDYRDFSDAFEQLAYWLEVEYMTERIHSALNYITPAEFEAAFTMIQSDSPLASA